VSKKSPKQLDAEINDALKRQSKSALMAEYHALKRSLANASLSDADIQVLRSKLAKIDAELVARNTAEYIEFEKRPRKGGY